MILTGAHDDLLDTTTQSMSVFGYDFGEDATKEFSDEDYQIVGSKFCESVYELHFVWK